MLSGAISQPGETTPVLLDSTELVERCQKGDPTAFRDLYELHFDFAWRTARRLGLPEGDTEDAVQESFHVAWQQIHNFTYGRFSTWLFKIVANVVAGKLRRTRVREVLGSLWGAGKSDAHSIEGRVEARQTLAVIERLLRKLSREKRETFALFEIEGFSHEQIAELTGTRVETVRTRLFYARREFERLAREAGVEP